MEFFTIIIALNSATIGLSVFLRRPATMVVVTATALIVMLTTPTSAAAPLCVAKAEDGSCSIPKLGLLDASVGECRTIPRNGECPAGQEGGTRIVELDPQGPLAKAGLKVNELIIGINVDRSQSESNSWTPHALYAKASTFPAGTPVKIRHKLYGHPPKNTDLIMG